MSSKLPERIMLAAFSIYAFVYPFALFLLSFDLMPFGMEWMSSLLLVLLGVTAWAWLWVAYGTMGLVIGAGILLVGLVIEYIGVQTGFPFGSYSYTGVLGPELLGGVPLTIGFAWLLIIVSSLFSVRGLLKTESVWAIPALGALLAVGFDFLLEPVAYHVKGFWLWRGEDGGYYGVPWVNFIAWFAIAFLLNLAVVSILNRTSTPGRDLSRPYTPFPSVGARFIAPYPNAPKSSNDPESIYSRPDSAWVPITLYVMNVAMFATVDIMHGFWWSGLIGLALLAGLWLLRRDPSTHHAPSSPTP